MGNKNNDNIKTKVVNITYFLDGDEIIHIPPHAST
jgi:hypothetical protein